jgi:hypothetical protein
VNNKKIDFFYYCKIKYYNIIKEMSDKYIEHSTGSLEFSVYHFHHNREPFYILFIKNDTKIYIEKIDPHSHRNKYIEEIVMPFDEMIKNENIKKFYDMSVMLANTNKIIYYNTMGVETRQLVCFYDTDSDSEYEDENEDKDEKNKKVKVKLIRHWFIICDFIWKNLRVSKERKCYYNMDPFTYEYNVNTEKEINQFMNIFNAFAKYHSIYSNIENMIITNYNINNVIQTP